MIFMQHKKSEHSEFVQMCTNVNSCPYQNCWFHHENNEQNTENPRGNRKNLEYDGKIYTENSKT